MFVYEILKRTISMKVTQAYTPTSENSFLFSLELDRDIKKWLGISH